MPRRLRHEVEDFCDQKLASFEIVLERTQKLVAAGREKLQGTNLLEEAAAAAAHGVAGPPPASVDDDLPTSRPDPLDDRHADGYDDDFYDEDLVEDGGVSEAEYHELPPPPEKRPETIRDAASSFFDQDDG